MPSGKPYGHNPPEYAQSYTEWQRRTRRDDFIRVALMCAVLTLASAAIGGAVIYTLW